MKLVLATHNVGKVKEMQQLLNGFGFNVVSLTQYPNMPEVIEDGSTFEANAIKKARKIATATGELALADDSGLEVDYLNNAPGVHSARFAGPDKNDESNNKKLLLLMEGVPEGERTARFRCVIAVATPEGKTFTAEGRCEGFIGTELRGSNGFGYDPLFIVPEYGKTFAELDGPAKNAISHRGQALHKIKHLLQNTIVS